jgi:hypothetical protein
VTRRQLTVVLALTLAAATLVVAAVAAVSEFPLGLFVLGWVVLALVAGCSPASRPARSTHAVAGPAHSGRAAPVRRRTSRVLVRMVTCV